MSSGHGSIGASCVASGKCSVARSIAWQRGKIMRKFTTLLSATAFLSLAGCGGGGGTSSAGSTPVNPPAATNSTLTNLQYSQSFVNDATTAAVALDLTTKTGISGDTAVSTLTISYDAKNQSYTVAVDSRTQTFGQADIKSNDPGQTLYQKSDGTNRDYLTLVKIPYTGTQATQYVGLGYWQRNVLADTRQDTNYTAFTYGLPTAAAAVPRTGIGVFGIDAFGFASKPGSEPISFQGHGQFSVDFGAAIFTAQAYTTETGLVSGSSTSGGGIDLLAGGHLSSNGTFSGSALYESMLGSAGGSLSGRFYGPSAEELGASFNGQGADGLTAVGSFTGQRDSSAKPVNLTLTNMTQQQLFYTQYGGNLVGQLNWQNAETFTASPPTSDLYGGQFTINDKVASTNPNFITYRKTFTGTIGSEDVVLELFKPGAGNSELALTYASFGHWSSSGSYGNNQPNDQFFTYGLDTPARLLTGKTGSGHYEGVAYGNAINGTGGRYDVHGSSRFDVNFTSQSYTGGMTISGTARGDGSAIDFGSFDFAGKIGGYSAGTVADILRNGQAIGQLTTRFYGPDGDEIAGPFYVLTPAGGPAGNIGISGVVAAKRQ